MLKKSLIIASVFCLIVSLSSLVFASNIVSGTENVLRDIGNGVQSMVDDAGNSVQDAKDGMSNMMNDWNRDSENMENGMTRNDNNDGYTATDNGDYTATRTGATNDVANTGTTFVWVVLAITAAIIVALVWYYATQTSDTNNRDNH